MIGLRALLTSDALSDIATVGSMSVETLRVEYATIAILLIISPLILTWREYRGM